MFDQPIFILGNPRSGTSLLRSIINSHDEVVIPPECGFIHYLYPKYKNQININEFVDDVVNSKKFEGWDINKDKLLEFLSKKKINSYQELCYLVYEFYGKKLNKNIKYWGDKNNYYINHLQDILEIYPNAKFIHIIRNPKDVFASYINVNNIPETKYKPKLPTVVNEFMDLWFKNNTNIFNFLLNIKNNFIELTYEELIFNPNVTTNKLFEFIGVSNESVLKNFNQNKFFDEPNITMGWKQKLIEEVDSKNFGKFKKLLTKEDILYIDEYIKKNIIKFKCYI